MEGVMECMMEGMMEGWWMRIGGSDFHICSSIHTEKQTGSFTGLFVDLNLLQSVT
jgi:hypothetical protein